MKIKKLLLISVIGAALALTGCNNKKSSSSQPDSSQQSSSEEAKQVKRLSVSKKPNVVVGDELDFESLVEITYDDGTKDNKNFTLEVPAASEELVEVEGHKATFLKEGSASITVRAGEKSAKFSTSILSKLKKDVTDAMNGLGTDFGYLELYEEDNQIVAAPYATHNESYTAFAGWEDNNTSSTDDDLPGGFLKTKSGSTYSYVLDQNWQNIDVDPTPYSEFGNYYVNMPFSFDIAHAVTMQDGSGEDYLHLPNTAASAYSFFHDSCQEFCYCSLALYFGVFATATYQVESIDVFAFEIAENVERYALTVNLVQRTTGTKYPGGGGTYLLIYAEDAYYGVQAVKSYVDSGSEPAGVDVSGIKAKFDALNTEKNFTVDGEFTYIVETSAGAPVSSEPWHKEEILANSTMYQESIYYYDDNGDPVLSEVGGFVEHEGNLYSFEKDEDSYPATLAKAGGTVYGDALEGTLVSLDNASYWANFFAPSMTTEGGVDTYVVGATKNLNFLAQFIDLFGATNYYMNNWREYAKTNYDLEVLADGYTDVEISVSADSFIVHLKMFAGSDPDTGNYTYYDFAATFHSIGSTAAITTPIEYPTV